VKLSQELRQARLNITGEGNWTVGTLHRPKMSGKGFAYCALGAVIVKDGYLLFMMDFTKKTDALFAVLQRRYLAGELPEPVFGGSMSSPQPWALMFSWDQKCGDRTSNQMNREQAITQFNNSTSQADVLDLFDEAISDAEAKERAEETNSTKIIDLTPEMEHAGT